MMLAINFWILTFHLIYLGCGWVVYGGESELAHALHFMSTFPEVRYAYHVLTVFQCLRVHPPTPLLVFAFFFVFPKTRTLLASPSSIMPSLCVLHYDLHIVAHRFRVYSVMRFLLSRIVFSFKNPGYTERCRLLRVRGHGAAVRVLHHQGVWVVG